MTTKTENTSAFAVVNPDDAEDAYAGTDLPDTFVPSAGSGRTCSRSIRIATAFSSFGS